MQEDHDAPKPREQGPSSGVIFLSVLLFAVWLVINASFEVPILIIGVLVSVALSFVFIRRSAVWNIPVTPARVLHFITYTGVFLVELVKANIEMLRYVYSPRIDIRPGCALGRVIARLERRPDLPPRIHQSIDQLLPLVRRQVGIAAAPEAAFDDEVTAVRRVRITGRRWHGDDYTRRAWNPAPDCRYRASRSTLRASRHSGR